MLSTFRERDIELLNKELEDIVKNNSVNHMSFFTAPYNKKVSAICKFESKTNSCTFKGCNKTAKIIENDSDFYYGLHPSIDNTIICEGIAEGAFYNKEKLCSFMDKLASNFDGCFQLESDQVMNLESLFALSLVRMSSHFAIEFKISEKTKEELINDLNLYGFKEQISYKVKKHSILMLSGLNKEMATYLNDHNYGYVFKENKIYITKSERKKDFLKFYQNESSLSIIENVVLVDDKSVYYSGVMPRVISIDIINDVSNIDVYIYAFKIQRTTYATVDAFDNGITMSHNLLKDYYNLIKDFYKKEDKCLETLRIDSQIDRVSLNPVCKYLKDSKNTHCIAVSANILTKEGDLILTKREVSAIDSGDIYPSVNGQSEVIDKNVRFYYQSVYADYPTLKADIFTRNDFSEEIERECKAELNLEFNSNSWKYYGISYLVTQAENIEGKRRMHFCVLAENQCEYSVEEIAKKRIAAVEKFENRKIMNLEIFDVTKKKIFGKQLFDLLKDNLPFILNLVALIILSFSTVIDLSGSTSNEAIEIIQKNISELILTFYFFIRCLLIVSDEWKRRKLIKGLEFSKYKIFDCSHKDLKKLIDRLQNVSDKEDRVSSIAVLLIYLYDKYKNDSTK